MTGSARWLAIFLLAASGAGGAANAETGRRWTLEDIVTVPTDVGLSLASDGMSLAYLEHRADLARDEKVAVIHLLDLRTGATREILQAPSAEQLRSLPNGKGWSLLLDRGDGLQLYQLDRAGEIAPLLMSNADAIVGKTEGGLYSVGSRAPRRVGILFHDWSPDGKWLWYATLKRGSAKPELLYDEDVVQQRFRRRAPATATVELRIRSAAGQDWLVASRPSTDRLAFYYGGNVEWSEEGPRYQSEGAGAETQSGIGAFVWRFADKRSVPVGADLRFPAIGLVRGPNGGTLSSEGFGSALDLVETRDGGPQVRYGAQHFFIGDPRSAGNWLAADGRTALLGIRTTVHPRYGLAVLTRRGARTISTIGSLTACDFREDLSWGICIEEALNVPPRFVRVTPETGQVRTLAPLSPAHQGIEPLRTTARQWTNRLGYRASGFIVWPRDYQKTRRYPAIIITHGSDADERFASPDLQWSYPAQLFAERGYVVILINDPSPRQKAELWNAHMQWSGGPSAVGPAKLRELIWLNGVYSFEDAIGELTREGIVDPGRVGIAGYSRGSQMVNVAMTQSTLFRAASSGDGAYLEPSSYSEAKDSYHAVFGGPPSGTRLEAYHSLSPSLRADKACGPILQQMASPFAGAIDFYTALRAAQVPAQISLYPGETSATDETHLFHIPSNRLKAMRENLAWFDFWLRDRRESEPADADRLERWSAMAGEWKSRCHPLKARSSASQDPA